MNKQTIVSPREDGYKYRLVEFPLDSDAAPQYRADLPFDGQLSIVRDGAAGAGLWAIDFYHRDELVSLEEARTWALAILGAADLAEELNQQAAKS